MPDQIQFASKDGHEFTSNTGLHPERYFDIYRTGEELLSKKSTKRTVN
ncbi:hypothetical protein [Chryseobacterium sp.]|nr:hypothetical protein [Chryseobacterium sp.]